MMPGGTKGSITVYLSIILSALIVLTGVLVDAARLKIGESETKRAVDSALESVLAGYDSQLKDWYGLFAYNSNAPDELETNLEYYINNMLMTELGAGRDDLEDTAYNYLKGIMTGQDTYKDVRFMNLFDFGVDNLQVKPLFNLSENQVMRNQILEFMKYRAPKELGQGLLDKLKGVGKISKTSARCESKLDTDHLATELGNLEKTFQEQVARVNRFDIRAREYTALDEAYKKAVDEYAVMLGKLNSAETGSESAGNEDNIKDHEAVKNTKTVNNTENPPAVKQVSKEELDNLKAQLEEKRRAKDKAYERLAVFFEKYIGYNAKAMETARKIEAKKTEILSKVGKDSAQLQGTGDIIDEFKRVYLEDMDQITRQAGKNNAGQLISIFSNNIKCLEKAVDTVAAFNRSIAESTRGADMEAITAGLEGRYDNKVVFTYAVIKNTGTPGKDSRKGQKREAEKVLKDNGKKGSELTKEQQKTLPSYYDSMTGTYTNKTESIKVGPGLEASGGLKGIDFEKRDFSKSSFNAISGFGEAIGKFLTDARDELYINEYIMGTFRHGVPVLKGQKAGGGLDLRLRDKQQKPSFFKDCEVEYILEGQRSENTNLSFVKGRILLLRFVSNTIYLYTDKEKKAMVTATAAALSSWLGGLSTPVVANLLMCGWGMLEAVDDLKDLMKGEAVPFFKTKDTWKTDMVPGKKSNPSGSRGLLALTYHDYLRIFLAIMDSETKMNRVQDLMQLNMGIDRPGFRISGCSTYLGVDAHLSMKYLFMAQPFLEKITGQSVKGRHQFKITMYRGY